MVQKSRVVEEWSNKVPEYSSKVQNSRVTEECRIIVPEYSSTVHYS